MTTIQFIRLFATLTIAFIFLSFFSNTAHSKQSENVKGIELEALQKTGYRLDWMNQSNANGLRTPTIIDDSLYVIDREDFLTRYERNTGKWLWSSPVGNQVFDIHGVTEFPKENRVFVISDGAVYVLEKTTGNYPTEMSPSGTSYAGQKQMLPLKFVANTTATTTDQTTLAYGSNNGDIIWFNPIIGFDIHRYNIGSSVQVQPTYAEGIRSKSGETRKTIIATSLDGYVTAVDLSQINKLWSTKLTSPVEAKTTYAENTKIINNETINRTSVFVAGTDQYIRSIDLHTGKQRWRILTTSPLTDSPVFVKNTIYQRIPNSGLAAYTAFPNNLSGERIWLAEDVLGNVITTRNNGQLVCWDNNNNLLQIVDPRNGGVVSSISIPTAKNLLADSQTNGALFVLTNDDAILRLVPRQ